MCFYAQPLQLAREEQAEGSGERGAPHDGDEPKPCAQVGVLTLNRP
jgi:hypothetical protein